MLLIACSPLAPSLHPQDVPPDVTQALNQTTLKPSPPQDRKISGSSGASKSEWQRQSGQEERAHQRRQNRGATAETPAPRYVRCPDAPAATHNMGAKHPPFPPHPPEGRSWLPSGTLAKAATFSLQRPLAPSLTLTLHTASPRALSPAQSTNAVLWAAGASSALLAGGGETQRLALRAGPPPILIACSHGELLWAAPGRLCVS